jgi:Mlc titration factor MtfA (ptsG expression regulator)
MLQLIVMPTNKIAFPFAMMALLFLYLSWKVDESYSIWIVPFLVIIAILFLSSPHINWWWWQRYPPDLEPHYTEFLEKNQKFYREMEEDQKKNFRTRVFLMRNGIDWTAVAFPEDNVPDDVKLAIATQASRLTLKKAPFLFDQFEKVVVYPRPFLSPEYPFNHSSELYSADGCLIFSADEAMHGFMQEGKTYNVVLHEYAKAFKINFPEVKLPTFLEDAATWEKLELVSKMSRKDIETTIGIAGVEAMPVAIHHYFVFKKQFQSVFKEEFEALEAIF